MTISQRRIDGSFSIDEVILHKYILFAIIS